MKTHLIGLKEFRMSVEDISKKVANGQSFIVLKRSQPVFKVSPVEDADTWETVVDLTHVKKGGVSINELLARL